MHIAHAIKQTEVQKAYNKRREKPIDYYLVSIYGSDDCISNKFYFVITFYLLQPYLVLRLIQVVVHINNNIAQ